MGQMDQGNKRTLSLTRLPAVKIIKISTINNNVNKLILDQGAGMRYAVKAPVTGWQNPFPCI